MICQVLGLDCDCLTSNNNDCLALSVPVGSLSYFSHSSSGFDSALSMLTYFLFLNQWNQNGQILFFCLFVCCLNRILHLKKKIKELFKTDLSVHFIIIIFNYKSNKITFHLPCSDIYLMTCLNALFVYCMWFCVYCCILQYVFLYFVVFCCILYTTMNQRSN